MDEYNAYVGLDMHKKTIAVAIAEFGRGGEVRSYGTIENNSHRLCQLAKRLEQQHGRVHFVYEAGPTGYVAQRTLAAAGYDCAIAAPSQVPRKSGDRVKTDRRDAVQLARLDRAGELTAIWVPDCQHEAIRELTRGYEEAVQDLRRARQRVTSFLLRQGLRYPGKTNWTRTHRRWLAELSFAEPANRVALDSRLQAVDQALARRDQMAQQVAAAVPGWRLAPVVEALRGLRGLDLVAAAGLAAEIGDVRRFAHPAQLMAYFGLVSSEHSSGERRRPGSITKTGSPRARKLLTEAAWCYRHPPRQSTRQRAKQAPLSPAVRERCWAAQTRLHARYRALRRAGKLPQVAVIAVARELAGFVWAVAQDTQPA
ncbi:MAG: IS110 family transposase [Rhodovibrio sp.]|nr:IS110 family transposase [Rhodovibrio sp.]